MKNWHTSLDSPGPDHHISLRLFGFVLASVALHSVIILSQQTSFELRSDTPVTMQITLGRIHPVETTNDEKFAKPTEQTPRAPDVPVPRRQTVPAPSREKPYSVEPTKPAIEQQQTETPAGPRQRAFTTQRDILPNTSKTEEASAQQQRISLNRLLQQALAKHFHYPMLARKRGWQGEVRLAFTLDTTGTITNAHIAQGSGYRALDRAALKSLHQVAAINKQLVQELNFELPVIYSLSGG